MNNLTEKETLQCLVGILRDRQMRKSSISLAENTFLIECENELMDLLIEEQITEVSIKELKERAA
jgi:hypothetical protein